MDQKAPQIFHPIALLSILLITVHLPSMDAAITTLSFLSDSRPTIILTDFCFTKTGHVSLTVSNVSVTTTSTAPMNKTRLAFYLVGLDVIAYDILIRPFEGKTCIVENPGIVPKAFHPIVTFRELSPEFSLKKTLPVPTSKKYGIYFANCEPNTTISMHVVLETYNLNDDGTKKYLGEREAGKQIVFFVSALFYLPFLIIWIYTCCENKAYVYKIHLVMALLLLVKAINLLCAAEDKYYIEVTGTPHGWDIMFYVFYSIRTLLFLTVVMLIGTGWSLLKPFLLEKEKKVLAFGISLQVFDCVAYIVIDESGPSNINYVSWNVAFFVLDFVGFLVVVVQINSYMKYLKEAANADGTAAWTLEKIRLFRNFYTGVIVYWYSTRTTKYSVPKEDCFSGAEIDAFLETFTILFYILMFYLFRPMAENEYFVIQDEEIALATIHSEFS